MTTGALSLIQTAVHAGVEVCFANPGTTEMPAVAVFDQVPGMRVVLGLFEGVCTGAADGTVLKEFGTKEGSGHIWHTWKRAEQ
jgi:acetolactate synthase I/II/III large subunit